MTNNLFEIFEIVLLSFFLQLLFLVEFHQGSSHVFINDKSRETGNQYDESDTLTTEFMSYIKASL